MNGFSIKELKQMDNIVNKIKKEFDGIFISSTIATNGVTVIMECGWTKVQIYTFEPTTNATEAAAHVRMLLQDLKKELNNV